MNLSPQHYFDDGYLDVYRAAQSGNADQVRSLVQQHRLDLERPGRDDMTLLALASIRGDSDAIMTLIRVGADPAHVIPDAGSPAVLAITRHFARQDLAAIKPLLDAGFDPHHRWNGKPWLFYLVEYRHWRGLEYALEKGADIDTRASWGKSLVTYAADRSEFAAVKVLLDRGADPSIEADNGDTLLLAIEQRMESTPAGSPDWKDLAQLRQRALAMLPDPSQRTTIFTADVEAQIRSLAPR